jgi:hypothetical protein
VGFLAFGRVVFFRYGASIFARSAKIEAQKMVNTLLPQAKSGRNAAIA